MAPCALSEATLRRPSPHPTCTWWARQALRQAHSWSCSCGQYSTLLLQKSGLLRLYLISLETHPFKGYLLALGPPGTNLPWVDFGVSLVGDQVRACLGRGFTWVPVRPRSQAAASFQFMSGSRSGCGLRLGGWSSPWMGAGMREAPTCQGAQVTVQATWPGEGTHAAESGKAGD